MLRSIIDSPGWANNILKDPVFMESIFSIALAYSTDGVNPFRSGQYTLWPLAFKVLNLPPALASSTALIILGGVVHGPKKPKTLQAYQLLIADEFAAGRRGLKSTSPCGNYTIHFSTKLVLTTADGPANGLMLNQQTANAAWGCIKCTIMGTYCLHRQLYGQVRRYLPLDHRYRVDPSFGTPEIRPPPEKRTLATTRRHAAYAELQKAAGLKAATFTERTQVAARTHTHTHTHTHARAHTNPIYTPRARVARGSAPWTRSTISTTSRLA